MSTLKTQYKNFLKDNPNSTLTFEQWKKEILDVLLKTVYSMNDENDSTNLEH